MLQTKLRLHRWPQIATDLHNNFRIEMRTAAADESMVATWRARADDAVRTRPVTSAKFSSQTSMPAYL